jgi:hypothetical protein
MFLNRLMDRSLGGWTAARDALKGGVHIMSDERILGDSVLSIQLFHNPGSAMSEDII